MQIAWLVIEYMATEQECDNMNRHVEEGNEEEDEILYFEEEDIRQGLEERSNSLVGRLLADRSFTLGTMENALKAIWGHPEGFRIQEHGDNVYQIYFRKEIDAVRIEMGSPWLFKNHILHLQRWKEGMNLETEDFARFPVWVQLWGLPEYCKTADLGEKIGNKLGKTLETAMFNVRGKEARIMKVRVELDASKVLKSKIKIAGPDRKPMEISFRYEKTLQKNKETAAVISRRFLQLPRYFNSTAVILAVYVNCRG